MRSKIVQYEQSTAGTSEKEAKLPWNVRSEQTNRDRNPHYISLCSKQEEDIVNESKQKKSLLHLCEQLTNNQEFDGGQYSISCLKGLRSLNLASCKRITDVSLKYSFDFLELEALSLSKCQLVTADGFECVTQKCPSIKVLNLSDCHNVCDRTIDIISSRLKRLTHLHIERCSQLTDISLDSIARHCNRLKYIDVRGCRSMCAEPSLKLQAVRSLQQILVSKPGPYIDNNNGIRPIPPPQPSF